MLLDNLQLKLKFTTLDANSFVMQFTEQFRQAIQDYTFLLEKKYPEKAVLELVSTRYSLDHYERSILYRGITIQVISDRRMKKLLTIEQLNHQTLHIDLFNVLFTIAAYLRGFPVYQATDGFIRDASESHGKGDWEVHLDKALLLIEDHLPELKILNIVIYLDNLLEFGLAIREKLVEMAKSRDPIIGIITDPSPDHLVREAKDGIIATSDSTIIDKSNLPVFDLPAFIIRQSFNKEIFSLADL